MLTIGSSEPDFSLRSKPAENTGIKAVELPLKEHVHVLFLCLRVVRETTLIEYLACSLVTIISPQRQALSTRNVLRLNKSDVS